MNIKYRYVNSNSPFGRKILSLVSIIFLCIGIFFIAASVILFFVFEAIDKDRETVVATVQDFDIYRGSDNETSTKTLVDYEIDGEFYTAVVSYYSSSMYIGGEVELSYNPNNPAKVYPPTGFFQLIFGLIFSIVGVVFTIVGIITCIVRRKYKSPILQQQSVENFIPETETPEIK